MTNQRLSGVVLVHNRTVLGSATRRENPVRHFDENFANLQLEESVHVTGGENLQL